MQPSPLSGLTIAVTASRRATELAQLITNLGGTPYIAPTVAIATSKETKENAYQFITETLNRKIDFIIVSTGPGIQAIFNIAKALGSDEQFIEHLKQIPIIARSTKPQQVLSRYGTKTNVSVPTTPTLEACIKLLMKHDISNKRIAISWHGANTQTHIKRLEQAGATILEVSAYKYSAHFNTGGTKLLQSLGYDHVQPDTGKIIALIEDLVQRHVDIITFTSPPAVVNLFKIAKTHNLTERLRTALDMHTVTVAIGPSTEAALEKHGIHAKVIPETFKMGPMIAALIHYLNQSKLSPSMKSAT